jgi:protein-S-isoprenylcysteine O-methyltransferase Ste14
MPVYLYVLLAANWLCWFLPFLLSNRIASPAKQVDRRARWGVVLMGVAFALLWQGRFWETAPSGWRIGLSQLLFMLASLLSWTGTRALGRQWRIDAGLSADHELVTSGPYRMVRHPIYASMLCLVVGTGLLISPWPLLLAAIVVFLVATEIRVRVEDQLLAAQFGESFRSYQKSVAAYISFVR